MVWILFSVACKPLHDHNKKHVVSQRDGVVWELQKDRKHFFLMARTAQGIAGRHLLDLNSIYASQIQKMGRHIATGPTMQGPLHVHQENGAGVLQPDQTSLKTASRFKRVVKALFPLLSNTHFPSMGPSDILQPHTPTFTHTLIAFCIFNFLKSERFIYEYNV